MRSEAEIIKEIVSLKTTFMLCEKKDALSEAQVLTALKYLSWVLNENAESPLRLMLGGGQ
jgi:hypothetical protein